MKGIIVSSISALFLIFGCASEKPPPETGFRPDVSGVSARIILPDSAFALGSEIEFALIVRPTINDTIPLTFANACKADFVVARDGFPIWTSLHNKACAQMLSHMRLAPNDSVVFRRLWDCTSNDEKGITLGKYAVRGLLMTIPPVETEWVDFYLVD